MINTSHSLHDEKLFFLSRFFQCLFSCEVSDGTFLWSKDDTIHSSYDKAFSCSLLVCATDHVFVLYQWKLFWGTVSLGAKVRQTLLALKRSFLAPSALKSRFALAALSVNHTKPSLWQRLVHCLLKSSTSYLRTVARWQLNWETMSGCFLMNPFPPGVPKCPSFLSLDFVTSKLHVYSTLCYNDATVDKCKMTWQLLIVVHQSSRKLLFCQSFYKYSKII